MDGQGEHPKPPSDLQAVILACEDGARLYPLTSQDCPASLLPVLNKPLLHYQFELLEKAGYAGAIVVCSRVTEAPVTKFTETFPGTLKVEIVVVTGSLDSAEVLRQVSGKLRTDFLLLPGDLVCEQVLVDLAELHISRTSDFTMVLKEEAPVTDSKGRKGVRPKRDEEDIDYIGLTPNNRLVIKLPKLFVEEALNVQKALLRRHEVVNVSTSLQDVCVYLLAHWVLDFLEEHKNIGSIQNELIPALVRRQFGGMAGGGKPVPKRQDGMPREVVSGEALVARATSGVPPGGLDEGDRGDSETGETYGIRCFALTLRHGEAYCAQAKTLAAYCTINRELLTRDPARKCPWTTPSRFRPKDSTLVGEGCHLGAKGTLKLSVIGHRCTIDQKAKINNCIIMDDVTIGENCTIQNSVICRRATVESGCNLNECYVGPECKVPAGTKEKQETYVVQ